ncbi:MAG: L-2-amino-thiazoline-4-carboxylic acid hydrolase [Candidatus Thorarchaeota archaeon]|jgi:hypothetical protein
MNKDAESIRATLWQKLQEIRGSYNEPERLTVLLIQWEKDFGPEHQDLVDEMIASSCRNYWREISSREGTSIDDLIRTQWMPWTEGEFRTEKVEDGIQAFVTKCPMADAFKSIGKVELGVQFFCNEDEHIVEGFNPSIQFTRTKTLMEGDDCCDHCYTMK